MPSLIDIRRRVRAVKSTQQITKAMKMVSSSKLRRAQERIIRSRPYAKEMLRVFNMGLGLIFVADAGFEPRERCPAAREVGRVVARGDERVILRR